MTIETQTPRVVIIGNGTRGPYSLVDSSGQAIRFMSTSHIRLTRYSASTDDNNDGSLLVLNTDYTVSGTQDARTFTLASGQAVLTSSQRILAERVQTYTQDLDLTTGGAFSATAVEARLDKIAEFQQELKARLDRTIPLQYTDSTANVALPSPPTSATVALGRNTSGAIVHLTPADFSTSVVLGTGWVTALTQNVDEVMDDAMGVRVCATYAAMTALLGDSALADNAIYYTYARATEEDGGAGFWRYDSGSSTSANGGTILAIDGGGAGRFFRLHDGVIDPRWYGVVVGGSDSTTEMQACITASYGSKIKLPPGTITCTNLTITGELEIEGAGYTRSILQQKTAATGTFITVATTSSKHIVFRAFDCAGVATGDDCIALTSTLTSGTHFIDMLVVLAGRDGISIRSTADDNTVILNTIVESCVRDGISFASGAVSGSVIGCRLNLNARYGVYATGNTNGPGHRIIGNAFGGGVAGIHVLDQNHCQISDNQIILASTHGIWLKGAQQCSVTGNASRSNTLDGIMLETGSQGSNYNTIADNVCSYNTRRGINLDTSPNGNTIRGNIITANGESGLRLNNAGYNSIIGNQIFNNGITTAPKAGIYIDDGGTGAASNNRIIGNYISDVGAGNQTTGIYNDASASNTTIIGNEIAATTEVNIVGGSVLYARDNIGWVTQNSGNSSIASGATSVTISHGLDVTPEAHDFHMRQSGATSNPCYISAITSITSTQFTVNCNTDPGASALPFEWAVSKW
jgi:parallel beta-helix repeat protein